MFVTICLSSQFWTFSTLSHDMVWGKDFFLGKEKLTRFCQQHRRSASSLLAREAGVGMWGGGWRRFGGRRGGVTLLNMQNAPVYQERNSFLCKSSFSLASVEKASFLMEGHSKHFSSRKSCVLYHMFIESLSGKLEIAFSQYWFCVPRQWGFSVYQREGVT